jgi:hypothetical protein
MTRTPRPRALLLPFLFLALLVPALESCRSAPPEPPPPAPERKLREVITWEVSPAEGYQDELSFVIVEYAAVETLRKAAADAAAGGSAEQEESQRPIPPGGRLTVHLGYRKIADANTAWFSFRVVEGAKVILRLDGEENVPNIKGSDGYWWNDVELDLEEPVGVEAGVEVVNRRDGVTRSFTLSRIVSWE